MARTSKIARKTNETDIAAAINLDGTGACTIETGVGFFDHMVEQLGKHGLIDIDLKADGDLHIDDHHTVEDCGWALGQAVHEALGDRKGITRYASISLPMDEALTEAAIDVSGRPFLVWQVAFTSDKIGTFDVDLVREFFQAFSQAARITLHIDNRYGSNSHHIAESTFKAVARVLRTAITVDPRQKDAVPSTKGSLNV
ncbi:MAG: imidazoleglycerol-phosphate dehydratase HisB [Pseudomonadota bacterium]